MQPEVEADRQNGYVLVFHVGEPADPAIPFRAILAKMVGALSQYAEAELRLPEYEVGEDFIEGRLRFGPHILEVYFEHFLGYLSLNCRDRAPLDEVWAILRGTVAVE